MADEVGTVAVAKGSKLGRSRVAQLELCGLSTQLCILLSASQRGESRLAAMGDHSTSALRRRCGRGISVRKRQAKLKKKAWRKETIK